MVAHGVIHRARLQLDAQAARAGVKLTPRF
jgi:hypothetical protein